MCQKASLPALSHPATQKARIASPILGNGIFATPFSPRLFRLGRKPRRAPQSLLLRVPSQNVLRRSSCLHAFPTRAPASAPAFATCLALSSFRFLLLALSGRRRRCGWGSHSEPFGPIGRSSTRSCQAPPNPALPALCAPRAPRALLSSGAERCAYLRLPCSAPLWLLLPPCSSSSSFCCLADTTLLYPTPHSKVVATAATAATDSRNPIPSP